MSIRPWNRLCFGMLHRIPLRAILIVPFIIQISVAVGLTGWFSWRNGQQTVQRLASQLEEEIGDRIHLKLQTYLAVPRQVNQVNADAIRLGIINVNDPKALERYFWHQLRVFGSVSEIFFANDAGGCVVAGRQDDDSLITATTRNFTRGDYQIYSTDDQGNRQHLLNTIPNVDPRIRSWYIVPVQSGMPAWSEIVTFGEEANLRIAASQPVYDSTGTLQGVVATDLVLSQVSEFLQGLEVGTSGQTFIVDHSGLIIATSADAKPFLVNADDGQVERLLAVQSRSPMIRLSSHHVIDRFGSFEQVDTPSSMIVEAEGQRYFLRIIPIHDEYGLDWLIGVVIPESDFAAQMNANARTTMWLCGGAFMVAIAVGWVTSRWIAKPIQRLSRASFAIAQGELGRRVDEDLRMIELRTLATSFNLMAKQVQTLNTNLEAQIRERTTQLQQAIDFEALLKRITDKVRDSLDEDQILQTVVRELAIGLDVCCCDTGRYDLKHKTSTICYEYVRSHVPASVGAVFNWSALPQHYRQLRQGLAFQFCWIEMPLFPRLFDQQFTVLVCPLIDDQGVWGDMCLYRLSDRHFGELEIRLVQQVANQCAIAIRQARLFHASQTQVRELEKLNRLKDDFLSTVSHELRSPMSNIEMAAQMLDILLNGSEWERPELTESGLSESGLSTSGLSTSELSDSELTVWDARSEGVSQPTREEYSMHSTHSIHSMHSTHSIHSYDSMLGQQSAHSMYPAFLSPDVKRYLQMLREECQRETRLINDLLDLCRLEADTEPVMLSTIDPSAWIAHIVEPFLQRTQVQHQYLRVDVSPNLPPLTTDLSYLERILTELLHNACKYTPPHESICVTVCAVHHHPNHPIQHNLIQHNPIRPNSRENGAKIQYVASAEKGTQFLRLSVTNSGIELPENERDRIFDKFYRIPNGDPWKHGGTGLGLALAKGLVERLGGEIGVESALNQTTFHVWLPFTCPSGGCNS